MTKYPVSDRDHVLGSPTAPVTLLEYGDYECPHCGHAYPIVATVLKRAGDAVRFAFRHFPLAEIHPHALAAAQAAEAAGAQKRFWPMHDILFEHQDSLEFEDLIGYAQALELDVPRFTRELESAAHLDKVKHDFHAGVRSGVNGTPTFFINGERYDGLVDAETLQAAIALAARPST
jgi:protein-disulfide isomerase